MQPKIDQRTTRGASCLNLAWNFLVLLTALLIPFKAAGLIDWSWWIVVAPLGLILASQAALVLLVAAVIFYVSWTKPAGPAEAPVASSLN